MDRRQFLGRGSALLIAVPFGAFIIQGCYGGGGGGDDGSPAAPPGAAGSNAVYTTSVDGGHSHTFAIALSAFDAPVETDGQTSTDDGHAHSVAISAAQLQDVQLGQTVEVTTGNSESHTHVITLVKVA